MTDWFFLLSLVFGFCSAFAEDPSSSQQNDGDPEMNDYTLNNRRYFLEPIADGKIIGSIGNLFSDKIREAANRERQEREDLRNQRLIQKYTAMLNDPEALEDLGRESMNSSSQIDQQIRRSFSRGFNQPIQNIPHNLPKKQLHRIALNTGEWCRGQERNYPRSSDFLSPSILRKPEVPNCLQIYRHLVCLGNRIREISTGNQAPLIDVYKIRNYGRQDDEHILSEGYHPNFLRRSLFPIYSILIVPPKKWAMTENVNRKVTKELNHQDSFRSPQSSKHFGAETKKKKKN